MRKDNEGKGRFNPRGRDGKYLSSSNGRGEGGGGGKLANTYRRKGNRTPIMNAQMLIWEKGREGLYRVKRTDKKKGPFV